MARVSFVPLDDLPEELRDAVARGQQSRMLSSPTRVPVWADRHGAALAWVGLLDSAHLNRLLDERLGAVVRLKIASITACQACQLARKSDQVTEDDIG